MGQNLALAFGSRGKDFFDRFSGIRHSKGSDQVHHPGYKGRSGSQRRLFRDGGKDEREYPYQGFQMDNQYCGIPYSGIDDPSGVGCSYRPPAHRCGYCGCRRGFGSQYLVRDIITGFFLIFENHYRIGDEVEFNGTRGIVEDITLRVTTLRDINGTVHTVPHGDITRVSNYSKSYAKVNLDVRVPYSADVEHVIGVINRVGEKLASDPEWEDKILKKPQFLRINDLGDSSVIFKIIGETKPLMQHAVTGELRKRLKKEFDKEGIEMPFPRVVVHQNRS